MLCDIKNEMFKKEPILNLTYPLDNVIASSVDLLKGTLAEPNSQDPIIWVFAYIFISTGIIRSQKSKARDIEPYLAHIGVGERAVIDAYMNTIKRLLKNKPANKEHRFNTVDDAVKIIQEALSALKKLHEDDKQAHDKALNFKEGEKAELQHEIETLKRDYEVMATKYDNLAKRYSKLEQTVAERPDTVTRAFCDIAERYMKANARKSQKQREKVSNALKDIMVVLKINLPEDMHKKINDFDNYHPASSGKTVNNISGNLTLSGSTSISGDIIEPGGTKIIK